MGQTRRRGGLCLQRRVDVPGQLALRHLGQFLTHQLVEDLVRLGPGQAAAVDEEVRSTLCVQVDRQVLIGLHLGGDGFALERGKQRLWLNTMFICHRQQ